VLTQQHAFNNANATTGAASFSRPATERPGPAPTGHELSAVLNQNAPRATLAQEKARHPEGQQLADKVVQTVTKDVVKPA
jgi:hypothetical protein